MSVPAFPPERKIWTVQALSARIRGEVERTFSDVWVAGEVANLKIPSSGHLYFTLKDAASQIKAIIFRSHGRFLRFTPKEGQSVLIRGHLSLYEAKGEYQLIVDYIEPQGAGALQAAFEALKEKLRAEGLFDPSRKRPIPKLPGRVALLTSPTGAVLRDLLKVLLGRPLPLSYLIYPVAVQGEGAADEIARGIESVNRLSARGPSERIDLLIVARGGGSLEDLWAFNEEIVARAIARSDIPVISAVGHETDTTIADFVSDLRAPTPSVAAEIVVRNAAALLERFASLNAALIAAMKDQLEAAHRHIASERRLLAAPARQLGHYRAEVDHLTVRLRQAWERTLWERRARLSRLRQGLVHLNPVERLSEVRRRLAAAASDLIQTGNDLVLRRRRLLQSQMAQLNILSPLNILERGYGIARRAPAGEVIREAGAVEIGETIEMILHRGRLICSVKKKVDVKMDNQDNQIDEKKVDHDPADR
ncbi:MAG: exodeoxyribonuclease VII large subunit [Nitrospirae bacterium]|nr:exodeoxyribonuclease VII large subunit [Candidatus Manganitrophaceae bacterium]